MLSMGIAAPWTAWAVSRIAARSNRRAATTIPIAAVAGFASVMAAAGVCSLELAAAGKAALGDVLPAMLGAHLLVGVSEALLTAALVAAVTRGSTRPAACSLGRRPVWKVVAASAAVAMLLAPWASSAPTDWRAWPGDWALPTQPSLD